MKSIILLIAVLFSFQSQALTGQYIKGALGISHNADLQITNGSGGGASLKNGFPLPLIAAYGFNLNQNFVGEVEFSYRKNELKGASSIDAQVTAFSFNLVHQMSLTQDIGLYTGMGAGLGQYDLIDSDKEIGIAVQMFTGMESPINDQILLGGELRYTTNLLDVEINNNKYNYDQFAILFTARITL